MGQCPYPETFEDCLSGKAVANGLYIAWHQGYEAHKFEIANLSIRLASLVIELETEVKNVKELKKELKYQMAKFQKS
jgi:hypothetical protein